ncbi:MAG: PfkB family carbohydrate kinase [Chloroflexi bacterium]|nr:PfkB family carbohydrate kinase [Chloroflexota bacterium]
MRGDPSSRPYDIIVFGDTCVDLILRDEDVAPQFGQVEKTVAGYDLVMGGSCCIFAAQAAKLGLRVAILGRVGEDYFGKLIVDALADAGVDTRYIEARADLRTGITVHLVQGDDRAMLTHMGSLNALTADDVTDEILQSARHLHYGSLYLQTGLLPDWIDILARAKRLRLTVSLDTNWDPGERWDHDLDRAFPLVDVLLPNEQEALRLSGAATYAEAIAVLRRRVPLLVVKRDIAGAVAWQGEEEFAQSVFEASDGGDGIGAGDSFDAGFLAGWLHGMPLASCLSLACECGRSVAGGIGGLAGQPLQAEIAALQPTAMI